MPRKIEDIKFNKDKRHITFKEEVVLRGEPDIEKETIVIKRQKEIINERRDDDVIKIYKDEYLEEKKIKEKESKIDEYLKSRQNSNTGNRRMERTPRTRERKGPISKTILFVFIIVVLGGVAYWGSNFFEKADISIKQRHQQIDYNGEQFIASKSSSSGNIDFEIMIVPEKRTKNITLTEPKEVSEYAKGEIILFNEYSTTAQNIVSSTMLADPDGKTYKLDKAITIPGYKTDEKGKIIKGQVSVTITAFLPGDVYNGSPDKLYLNAFKGTEKYEKIYGQLKAPLSGGASGLVYTLNEKDKENVKKIAETSFKEELYDKVKALVPEGYILYEGATNFSYKSPDNFYSKEADAKVEIEGTLAVVLLKEKSLMQSIIQTSIPKISEDEMKEIKISGLENFIFNFTNMDQQITKDTVSIPFTLSGDIDAVWYSNPDLLKSKLLGVHKDDTLAIFRQDPGISSAMVKIFPPWQKNLPENIDKININFQ